MSYITNSTAPYSGGGVGGGNSTGRGRGRGGGGRGRGRGRGRGGTGSNRQRNTTGSTSTSRSRNVSTSNQTDENDERNERDRNEFIASFQLNITTASSPILVRNDIRKLGNNCYSARVIREYFQNSNPHNVNIHIKQIWKVHNVGDYVQFMRSNYDQVDNQLLWHGTSRQNLVSILQNKLQLPVSATNGHMFGPGIYFADRMSKSANYTDKSGPEVFLLCQVALGKKWRVYQAERFTSAPGVFNTLKAVGKNVPDIGGEKKLGEYCKIPCGRTVQHRDSSVRYSSPLEYNEYIVFDQDRIRIKFIVHCERGGSSSYVAPTIYRPLQTPTTNFTSSRTVPSRTSTLRTISSGTTYNQSYTTPTPQRQNSSCVIL